MSPNFIKPIHYEISANVMTAKARLKADCRIRLLNPNSGSKSNVEILLNRGLKVNSATYQNRNVKFTQKHCRFTDLKGFEVNLVEVHFDEPLEPQGEAWIDIEYEGEIKGYEEVFGYTKDKISREYSLMRPDVYSYPVIGVPEFKKLVSMVPLQRFSYKLHVTVPKGFVVANAGQLVVTQEAASETTYVYASKLPSWRIDIAISKFKHQTDADADLHVFTLSENSVHSERVLNELRRCRAFYRDRFGEPLRWTGYTIIEIPEGWGSQADVCGMLLGARAFKDTEGVGGVYHELAHLWNAKSGEEVPSRFLDEGFASYFQLLAEKEFLGETRFQKRIERVRQRFVEMATKTPLLLEVPISDYGKHRLTDASYPLGAWILFVLHNIAGDQRFNKMVKTFLERHSEKPATLTDFKKAVVEICGMQLEKFTNEWLFENKAAASLKDGSPTELLMSVYRL